MIENLINRTNTNEFYQNGYLRLVDLKGRTGNSQTLEFNFIVEEQDDFGEMQNIEHWTIIAKEAIDFNGIFADSYLPYIKMNILTDHPLIWAFNHAELECELNKYPENPSEFIGDLFFEYESVGGNWIPLHKNFWALNKFYKENKKRYLSIPSPLRGSIEKVCEKHGIEFRVKKEINGYNKGDVNRPNAKLLIFGNEEVCPNSYSLGQPYIIADEFIAKKR